MRTDRPPSARAVAEAVPPWARATERTSGGQQQRVAIARALAREVDILFADEPTGSLERATAAGIMEVLRKLAHDDGTCVFVVPHSRDVAAVSDDVLHLERGRLSAGS